MTVTIKVKTNLDDIFMITPPAGLGSLGTAFYKEDEYRDNQSIDY